MNNESYCNLLEEAFSSHLVIPDVLGAFPNQQLNVSYRDNSFISLGNLIIPENVINYNFY